MIQRRILVEELFKAILLLIIIEISVFRGMYGFPKAPGETGKEVM